MTWELTRISEQYVQWVDRENADAWLAEAGRLAAMATPTAWDAQQERTRLMAEALGNFARACDLPIPALAPYATRQLRADPGENNLPGVGLGDGEWRPRIIAIIYNWSPQMRDSYADGGAFYLDVYQRIALRPDGTVIVRPNVVPELSNGLTDFTRAGGVEPGSDVHPSGWTDVGWREWWPGFGEASHTGEVACLVPLQWTYELLRESIRECVRLGVDGTILASRAWVVRKNLVTARALGADIPEDIITTAAADQELAMSGIPAEGHAIFGVATAIAAAANPVAGLIVGVFSTIAEVLFAIGGTAVAYWTDVWGRREPVLEEPRISGVILAREQHAPTHELAPPPPMTDRTSAREAAHSAAIRRGAATTRPTADSGTGPRLLRDSRVSFVTQDFTGGAAVQKKTSSVSLFAGLAAAVALLAR